MTATQKRRWKFLTLLYFACNYFHAQLTHYKNVHTDVDLVCNEGNIDFICVPIDYVLSVQLNKQFVKKMDFFTYASIVIRISSVMFSSQKNTVSDSSFLLCASLVWVVYLMWVVVCQIKAVLTNCSFFFLFYLHVRYM